MTPQVLDYFLKRLSSNQASNRALAIRVWVHADAKNICSPETEMIVEKKNTFMQGFLFDLISHLYHICRVYPW